MKIQVFFRFVDLILLFKIQTAAIVAERWRRLWNILCYQKRKPVEITMLLFVSVIEAEGAILPSNEV